MTFQPDPDAIRWRLHLASSPEVVYDLLATDEGRARFWAEETVQDAGRVTFRFPGGITWTGDVLETRRPRLFRLVYFGTTVTFTLEPDGEGGTDLLLQDERQAGQDRVEVTAGWLSVLLSLKAAADFGVDLRNHDPERTWDQGYVDN